MIEPTFEHSSPSGSPGVGVTLQVMPRTEFTDIGFQTGVRLITTKDGESVYEQTIGLDDAGVDSLISALMRERGHS